MKGLLGGLEEGLSNYIYNDGGSRINCQIVLVTEKVIEILIRLSNDLVFSLAIVSQSIKTTLRIRCIDCMRGMNLIEVFEGTA